MERTFAVDTMEYREAFLKNLMGMELDVEERAAVSASAAIPTETMNLIVSAFEQSPLLRRVTILNIPGNVTIPKEKTVNDAKVGTSSITPSIRLASSLSQRAVTCELTSLLISF